MQYTIRKWLKHLKKIKPKPDSAAKKKTAAAEKYNVKATGGNPAMNLKKTNVQKVSVLTTSNKVIVS